MTGAERAEQMHFQYAGFAALGVQLQHGFVHGLGARSHQHDHPLCIGRAHVIVQMVGAAGAGGEGVHAFLQQRGKAVVKRIAGFPCLEKHVGVLGGAAQHRMIRRQCTPPVFGNGVLVERAIQQRTQIVVFHQIDFRHLVRGAEAIKKMQHRNAGTQRDSLGEGGKIMGLLHRVGGHQRKAGPAR